MGVPERPVRSVLLFVVEARLAVLVAFGFDVDALDEVVDDSGSLGWGCCVEAAGEAFEELREAEAAGVAALETSLPSIQRGDAVVDLVEIVA